MGFLLKMNLACKNPSEPNELDKATGTLSDVLFDGIDTRDESNISDIILLGIPSS